MEYAAVLLAKKLKKNGAQAEMLDQGGVEPDGKIKLPPKVKTDKSSDEDSYSMLRSAAKKATGSRKKEYEKALAHKKK